MKVLKRQDRLTDEAPSSLLYTIATNTCLNIIRTRGKSPLTGKEELLQMIAGPEDQEAKILSAHFTERLFRDEAASTKTMAVLHYVDGFTLEETAEMVGLSVSGVRKRLRGLRQRGLALKEV